MHINRRKRQVTLEAWHVEQLDSWRWDSHLWDMASGQYTCKQCGWVPPEGVPTNEVRLCMGNPAIIALMRQITAGMDQVFHKLGLKGGESDGK